MPEGYISQLHGTYLNFMQVKVGSNEKKNSEKDLSKIEASFAGGEVENK